MLAALLTIGFLPDEPAAPAEPAPVAHAAFASRSDVSFFSADGAFLRRSAPGGANLAFSPDGARLAIVGADGKLHLFAVATGESTELHDSARQPVWDRGGRLLFASPGRGIFAVAGDGPPRLIVPRGQFPAPDPAGGLLAFSGAGAQAGVWVAKPDGGGARRLLRSKNAGGVSWSYDGRWIAAVVDGRLKLLRPNGQGVRDLGEVNGSEVSWSGGSSLLIARRGTGWSAWDFVSNRWSAVDLDASSMPQWIGPRRLLGLKGARPAEAEVGGSSQLVKWAPEAEMVAAAQVPGTYLGAAFPDPFAEAPRPKRGQVAVRGRIESVDPVVGEVILLADSELGADGAEREFILPRSRRFWVDDHALMRRLTVAPETDVWIVAERAMAVDAFLPEAEEAAAPALRARRPLRETEYDGVSLDRVVVPMVYPIPGDHKFTGTFLAPRGGGTRRHHGNDLMAPKMTPLLAVFDGVVSFTRTDRPNAHNILRLRSDDGWVAAYMHINNDTPGTDDGLGSLRYAFPADLQPGDFVRAGELIGWVGDSGNAESTPPHLHFELHDAEGMAILDPSTP
jgi:murein DD-endopeptidase MepM/ murein hydrolase activator NlpD